LLNGFLSHFFMFRAETFDGYSQRTLILAHAIEQVSVGFESNRLGCCCEICS